MLHYAAERGHIDLCSKLLEIGADVAVIDGVSECIIFRAILLYGIWFSRC